MNFETWHKPTSFPQVPENATIAVDTETMCEDLNKKGPQFLHGPDYVIGISLAMIDGYAEYFPIAHKQDNCEIPVVAWFKELLNRKDLTFVGANTKFDLEGMYKLGIVPKCHIADMQVTDSLLDENNSSYSLDSIAKRRGFGAKEPGEMEEQLVIQGYVKRGEPDWSMLYKLHPKYVGPYAAKDALLTLQCHMQQMDEIVEQELTTVYNLECKLIPILSEMRRVGVRVDIDAADQLNSKMGIELEDEYQRIITLSDHGAVDPFSPKSLSNWVRAIGFEPPATKQGSDSVSNEWLAASGNGCMIDMAAYRQGERFRRDVLQGVLLDQSHNGRIHASWYSTRGSSFMAGEDGGTRSGRLSSGSPSLQVMPSRHPVYGPVLRRMFLPDPGKRWFKGDYNSQEVRIGVHFAAKLNLTGADDFVKRYIDNPLFDYHEYVKNLINEVVIDAITRGTAKTTGLSLQYGMGLVKLAIRLGLGHNAAKAFLETFHAEIPWIKEALNAAMKVANERGFVKSILGRRRRFDDWENANYGSTWAKPIRDKRTALMTFGKIKRAGTYKAWNSVVQGTAAEMTKTAMVNAYENDILVSLSVHDELCASLDDSTQAKRMKDIMEHSIKLCIPVAVDASLSDDWAGTNKEVI